jgi:hypothetical protein
VQHTVNITNTGNVRLRDVSISTALTRGATPVTTLGDSAYSCAGGVTAGGALPNSLDVHSYMVCTAVYTLAGVADIEAGDLDFTAAVSAASVTPETLPVQTLLVPNKPSAVVTLDASTCNAPNAPSEPLSCPAAC